MATIQNQTQTAVPVSPPPVRIELALTAVVAGLSVLVSSVSVVLWRRAITPV